jgi:hypothetical protein
MHDQLVTKDHVVAGLVCGEKTADQLHVRGYYVADCYDAYGQKRWSESFQNVVTTLGKNDMLDKYLKGSAYSQSVRMGLKGPGTYSAADTQASHAGWSEAGLANAPTYTGNRKDVVMGSASVGSSVSPAQAFAITSTGTVSGCFINNNGLATKDDTTGVLFAVGDFSQGRQVFSGDTLNVTYTLSV